MGEKRDGVCRDFERGVCDRGANGCKFKHPEELDRKGKPLSICKDFQNFRGCDRPRCKFLHFSKDEENHYNATGVIPPHRGDAKKVRDMEESGGYDEPPRRGGGFGGPPPPMGGPPGRHCKDFLNNKCDRAPGRCKFRHVTERELALEATLEEVAHARSMGPPMGPRGAPPMGRPMGGPPMLGKRSRRDDDAEENEMLKRKITDLQKQVVDLRQMNDTLYEQNMKYREKPRGGPAPSSSVYSNY